MGHLLLRQTHSTRPLQPATDDASRDLSPVDWGCEFSSGNGTGTETPSACTSLDRGAIRIFSVLGFSSLILSYKTWSCIQFHSVLPSSWCLVACHLPNVWGRVGKGSP